MRSLLLLLQRRTHRTVCARVILCSLLIPESQESRRLAREGWIQADGPAAAGSPAANRRIMIPAWMLSVWLTPSPPLCLTTMLLIRPCSWAGLLFRRRLWIRLLWLLMAGDSSCGKIMAFLKAAFRFVIFSFISHKNSFHGCWWKSPANLRFKMDKTLQFLNSFGHFFSLSFVARPVGVPGLVASARMLLFSVFLSLFWKDGGYTNSGIHPARQRGAGGNDGWLVRGARQLQIWHRRNFGQLEAFTGSSRPTSDRQRRSFSADSSRRSRGTRNFSCEVFEFPIQASQCSYLSFQGLLPFVFFFSSPGSPLSPRPVVHTRDVFTPQHAHFSYIISRFWTRPPCFPPYRAGLEGSIQGDLQL